MLGGISFGLLVLFVCWVVLGAQPLRLLDPRWQSDFCQLLIDHSAIPLTAFGLVHLAAFLVRNDERLLARRQAMRHAAVAVVLGFLLLTPLQGWALWQNWSAASGGRAAGLQRARTQIEQLRRAIDTAGSSSELQERLRSLRAPGVPAAELARPLPELKQLMGDRLQGFEPRLEQHLGGGGDGRDLRQRLPTALRVVLVSLGMAAAWASGAEISGVEGTLLERGLAAFDRSRARRHGTGRRKRGGSAAEREFFEQLAGTEPSPQGEPQRDDRLP